MSNSDAGSESEDIIIPENARKLSDLYKGVPSGPIGCDSDSDFIQSKQNPKKSRLSSGKKGPKKYKKSSQNNTKPSSVPSTSGLAQPRESSPDFSDPIRNNILAKYRYRKARSESESSQFCV